MSQHRRGEGLAGIGSTGIKVIIKNFEAVINIDIVTVHIAHLAVRANASPLAVLATVPGYSMNADTRHVQAFSAALSASIAAPLVDAHGVRYALLFACTLEARSSSSPFLITGSGTTEHSGPMESATTVPYRRPVSPNPPLLKRKGMSSSSSG